MQLAIVAKENGQTCLGFEVLNQMVPPNIGFEVVAEESSVSGELANIA
jgi:hypothetical protein